MRDRHRDGESETDKQREEENHTLKVILFVSSLLMVSLILCSIQERERETERQ
jgi:hypothetical protein